MERATDQLWRQPNLKCAAVNYAQGAARQKLLSKPQNDVLAYRLYNRPLKTSSYFARAREEHSRLIDCRPLHGSTTAITPDLGQVF